MRFFAIALVFYSAASFAQSPEVPQKMGFADMTLTLRDDVRREIQADVDKLTQHKGYYTIKVERARTYFPIIEKIFREEGLPDDFKYLVLQESALVADAVSVSNAVGFWQFKDFTALEMGLRVDREVDERMNIVSATRGAARYLKKSNAGFDNWLLTLQSYQMGAGGTRRAMGDTQNGAKNVEVTADTYWYVKKFLAHKVAFENAVAGEGLTKVIPFDGGSGKTLKEIAQLVSADESDLKEYNKWLKGSSVPGDKPYSLLIPVGKLDADFTKLVLASSKASKAAPIAVKEVAMPAIPQFVNSIPALIARKGESVSALALRGSIGLSSFLKYNDIGIDHTPAAGDVYLLGKKKGKGEAGTVKVKPGEDLWTVSQRTGVKIRNLKKYNRLDDGILAAGTLVWLQGSKPDGDVALPTVSAEVVTLEEDTFDWSMKSPGTAVDTAQVVTGVVIPVAPAEQTPVEVAHIVTPLEIPVSKPTEHVVRAGDTFYSIARQYGIEVTDVLNWNNLSIEGGIRPGQVLKVVENEPIKAEVPLADPVLVTHEVKPSDTLYSIARQYGVTIKDIMDWNHKTDFSLTRGEKLAIRKVIP